MQVTTADAPGNVLRRAAPIAGAAAALAGLALVAANDPAAPGSRFPACAFRSATGWWCPGCGLTRGLHLLVHGDVPAALGQNVFTPLALTAGMWLWVVWMRTAWGRPVPRLPAPAVRSLLWGVLPVVVLYGVLRNVPAFDALAP